MPLIETKGAASAQGFGLTSGLAAPVYVEDVFSTYLYTGNGSTQNITNDINLSGKGGLVWLKSRSDATDHALYDTARGATKDLVSNSTGAETTQSTGLTAFSGTGFSLGALVKLNTNAATYVSWTFREQAKFFDVVTYTGNGSNRTISHNLGSVPGCILVKRTNNVSDWQVYHRSLVNTDYLVLNTTAAKATGTTRWNSTTPTSTEFSLGTDTTVNGNGDTYVAYLFAHDAGGFGLSGSDNVISCGSATGNLSTLAVTLGYEPQWLLFKRTDAADSWYVWDNMRGFGVDSINSLGLLPNTSTAESVANYASVTSTGFNPNYGNPSTIIYIAIRRGPMRTPTSGTSVFTPQTWTGTGTNSRVFTGSGFPLDMVMIGSRDAVQFNSYWLVDRLRGPLPKIQTASTSGDTYNNTDYFTSTIDSMDGYTGGIADFNQVNNSGSTRIQYFFRRAPGFFDVVCYTGTGSNTTQTHNLGVVPELIIVKRRDTAGAWDTYSAALSNTEYLVVDTTAAKATGTTRWNSTTPTSTVFSLGTSTTVNASSGTYVAYLFATVAGVSKVGSYTGTGTTLQINCGFTGGARFVLIKRTDSTGDWYVYDSARGIVAGNDPYLLLNSTAAEVTSTDYVDASNAGFELSSTAPAGLNANGGTYIFLAIA